MKERCTNTSNDFWKKIHKLPQTQETKPVTKLQRQSNLCCCTKQASKQARISPSPQKKKNKKKKMQQKQQIYAATKQASKQENAKTKFFKTQFPFYTNSETQNDHCLEYLENMGG
jgi:hypothetical protein